MGDSLFIPILTVDNSSSSLLRRLEARRGFEGEQQLLLCARPVLAGRA